MITTVLHFSANIIDQEHTQHTHDKKPEKEMRKNECARLLINPQAEPDGVVITYAARKFPTSPIIRIEEVRFRLKAYENSN